MLAWIVHPLLLSSQFLSVQRMTLLSGTFSLAGLWLYVRMLPKASSMPSAFGLLALLASFTLLALLSKENGALLPAFAWVLQATLLQKRIDEKPTAIKHLLNIGVAIPSLAVFTYIVYVGLQPYAFSSRDYNLAERLMTQTHVLADYIRIALLPRLSDSGIYHDDLTIIRQFFQPVSTVLLSIGILSSLVGAMLLRRKWPLLSFAVLWFFAGHAMESSFIALELYFEHRNYLPLIGPVVALTAAPFFAIAYRKLAFGILFLWLLALGGISAVQARMWGNWGLLATVWAADRPLSLRSAQELGSYYISIIEPEKAVNAYLKARQRGITSPELPLAALLVSCQNNIPNELDLFKESLLALENSNYSNGVFSLLQKLRMASNNSACPDMMSNEKWWQLSDAFLSNRKLRYGGEYFVRIERSRTAFEMENPTLAFQELDMAFRLNPTVELSNKIAKAYIANGNLVEARRWLETGLNTKETTMQLLMSSQKKQSERLLDAIDRFENTMTQK
jgi:tetratricopeptide (TPR) repeat protein